MADNPLRLLLRGPEGRCLGGSASDVERVILSCPGR
jgi:hypothetical protein